MSSSQFVSNQGKDIYRQLEGGIAIYRFGRGNRLEQVCGNLATLRSLYPTLEVRIPGQIVPRVSPTIHELDNTEVRSKSARIGHLSLSAVLSKIVEDVPSLGSEDSVVMDEVDTTIDPNTGAEFILLSPTDRDHDRLVSERRGITSVISEMAGAPDLDWGNKPRDMTIAYVPEDIQDKVTVPILKMIKTFLPIRVDLEPARY